MENKKEGSSEVNWIKFILAAIAIISAVAALYFAFNAAVSSADEIANEKLNVQEEEEMQRISIVSEEIGVPTRNIQETKSPFKDYYEYTTADGNYRIQFTDDNSEIKLLLK